jgi:cysteine desulfurase / selenocysteine lyase
MTIADLHANEELRRHEFPVVAKSVYLAHAGICPLPRRVAEVMSRYTMDSQAMDQEEASHAHQIGDVRGLAARLIGAQPEEVALVGPTSLALSFVAAGLPWRKGQNILVYYDDYPSNVYPWMALADRGVEVRFLNVRELGKVRLIDVQGQVDEDTRLVALASAHYLSGWRLNLEPLSRFLRSRGIWFCLDGIQTVGAFPTLAQHADFLAADAHKWMLGPCAAGILYVRRELQDTLRPVAHGWHNVKCPNFLTQDEIVFRQDARRYEAGTHAYGNLLGLKAACELLLEVGVDNIAAELVRKRAWLTPALEQLGFTVLQSHMPPENAGAITAFHRPGTDMPALHRRLSEAGITTSLRRLPTEEWVVRLSPHFYTTDAELNRVIETLGTAA